VAQNLYPGIAGGYLHSMWMSIPPQAAAKAVLASLSHISRSVYRAFSEHALGFVFEYELPDIRDGLLSRPGRCISPCAT
jgi:hypothetical protein